MRKALLLAMTAIMLAGPAAIAGGGKTTGKMNNKVKKQECTQCTRQNCTGAKCASCCAHGQCTKG